MYYHALTQESEVKMKKLLDEIINSGEYERMSIVFVNGIEPVNVYFNGIDKIRIDEMFFAVQRYNKVDFIPYSKIAHIEAYKASEETLDVLANFGK
jgi:hypothetical protein